MSRSPVDGDSADPSQSYLDSWGELAGLIRQGRSFSGKERNCCFLNTRDGRFADVSSATGLDHIDDGRTVALSDWDRDGDLDLWLANRTGPRLRFMRNELGKGDRFVAFRLRGDPGRGCSRDAIGARVEVEVGGPESGRRIRTLYAGDGYLSQSSKWVHLGLGESTSIRQVSVRWPGNRRPESFQGVKAGGHYLLAQGSGRAAPGRRPAPNSPLAAGASEAPELSDAARIRLSQRPAVPTLSYKGLGGERGAIKPRAGRALLVNLWATWCLPCLKEIGEFNSHADELNAAGVDLLFLNVDNLSLGENVDDAKVARLLGKLGGELLGPGPPAGFADKALVGRLEDLQRELIYRQRQLPLPSSVLIAPGGRLAAVYKGPVSAAELIEDAALAKTPPADLRGAAVPFPGRWGGDEFQTNVIAIAGVYLEGKYPGDAVFQLEKFIGEQNALDTSSLPPQELLHHRRRLADVHDMLGMIALQSAKPAEAVKHYQAALAVSADRLRTLVVLAKVYSSHPDNSVRDGREALALARRACELTPSSHPDALDALAAAHAENGDFEAAAAAAREAVAAARKRGATQIAASISRRLRLYEAGRPFRQGGGPGPK
ncbi:MAG: ASPIC/UnbV domain-containing protein [Planctomycetes bacterium]|nr:ASPIC/UnbV domain-containing protein [Planctomycetota bacterium]